MHWLLKEPVRTRSTHYGFRSSTCRLLRLARWTLKFDDFAFSNVSCGNTYYSQSTGAVNDAIWSTAMVGTPGVVNFTIGDNMVLQNTHVVTVINNSYVRNLNVQTGSELVLNTGITLSAFGTAVDLDGTITAAYGSTLALVGTSAVALGTTGTPALSKLTLAHHLVQR